MSEIAITDTPKLKKDKRGRFIKGNAGGGNPGGRPKSEAWFNQRVDENIEAYWGRLHRIAMNSPSEVRAIEAIVYLVNRRFGKPKTAVQIDSNVTRSYVLRAPPVLSSSELWEQKYGLPEAIDVTPAKVEQTPHEVYQTQLHKEVANGS
jgi:hypothetical protein